MIRHERSEVSVSIGDRKVEKRKATLKKITLSAPCRKQQSKKKNLKGKNHLQTWDLLFLVWFFYISWKKRKKNGGRRGIRTLGELPLGGFQDRCLKPLDHSSADKIFSIKYHVLYDFTTTKMKISFIFSRHLSGDRWFTCKYDGFRVWIFSFFNLFSSWLADKNVLYFKLGLFI